MSEQLRRAAAMLGMRMAEQTAANMIKPSGKYTGKWDRTYMNRQNGFKSSKQESNKWSQFIYNGVFVFKFQVLKVSFSI